MGNKSGDCRSRPTKERTWTAGRACGSVRLDGWSRVWLDGFAPCCKMLQYAAWVLRPPVLPGAEASEPAGQETNRDRGPGLHRWPAFGAAMALPRVARCGSMPHARPELAVHGGAIEGVGEAVERVVRGKKSQSPCRVEL